MRRLTRPNVTLDVAFNACVDGVKDQSLQDEYRRHFSDIEQAERCYFVAAKRENYCELSRTVGSKRDNPVVLGSLKKDQLKKLYTQYMVGKDKPGRSPYDKILAAANGKCPFCGGIGNPKTLDHYLPKANYPQYSVTPINLVPCCRDCNVGKSNSVASSVDGQVLHPYFDKDAFFNERWLVGVVNHSDPVTIEFQVSPPGHWSPVDKHRVESHFKSYGIGERYAIVACTELPTIIHLRKTLIKDSVSFCDYLANVAADPSLAMNSWKKVMYQALADDQWFVTHKF